jgi:predicted CoA-binding protein
MHSLDEAVQDFLAQGRIAVVGVSRMDTASPANLIWRKLRKAGYETYAVNSQADEIEGQRCYRSLSEIPGGVGAVVLAAPAAAAESVVDECARLRIRRLWMHRSFGTGSVAPAAVKRAHTLGINVIAGVCPMMYVPPVDFPHRCMKFLLRLTGSLPVVRELDDAHES